MKRQSSSLCESSSSSSSKRLRLRLEYEIFSTSIQDIEKMFTEEILTSNNSITSPDSSQYLDNLVTSTQFKYDCINMAFLEDKKFVNPLPSPLPPFCHRRPNSHPRAIPQPVVAVPKKNLAPEKSMYLDLNMNEEEEEEEYNNYFDYDGYDDELQNYKPSINQDLLMIDNLILFNR